MTPNHLSQAVADATAFLLKVHDDIRLMLVSFDKLFALREWEAADGDRVSWDLGRGTLKDRPNGMNWVVNSLGRYYIPKGTSSSSAVRFIAIGCKLAPHPNASHGFATLLAAAVHFANPTDLESCWESDDNDTPYAVALGSSR